MVSFSLSSTFFDIKKHFLKVLIKYESCSHMGALGRKRLCSFVLYGGLAHKTESGNEFSDSLKICISLCLFLSNMLHVTKLNITLLFHVFLKQEQQTMLSKNC